jgi:hypothetical protein
VWARADSTSPDTEQAPRWSERGEVGEVPGTSKDERQGGSQQSVLEAEWAAGAGGWRARWEARTSEKDNDAPGDWRAGAAGGSDRWRSRAVGWRRGHRAPHWTRLGLRPLGHHGIEARGLRLGES